MLVNRAVFARAGRRSAEGRMGPEDPERPEPVVDGDDDAAATAMRTL